jgi:ferrous iron transport protein A
LSFLLFAIALTTQALPFILISMLQVSVKRERTRANGSARARSRSLSDLHTGEQGVLRALDLPEDQALRLMELGFLPGATVAAALQAPGGDPRVYRVDGSEFALRRETASRLTLQDSQ